MKNFLETVFFLDATNDLSGLIHFVSSGSVNQAKVARTAALLLTKMRVRSAFVLAKLLNQNGYHDPILSITLSLGGILFNMPEEEAHGLALLHAQADRLSPDQQTILYRKVIIPVLLFGLLGRHIQGLSHYSSNQILQILEIVKSASPLFRKLFDWQAPVPTLPPETIHHPEKQRARLLSYRLPPPNATKKPRRVVVAMTKTHDLGRANDIGPRITTASNLYGWQTTWYGMKNTSIAEECHATLEICHQYDAEILFLELDRMIYTLRMAQPSEATAYATMIQQLRQEKPTLKIVGCLCDAWSFDADELINNTRSIDLIWDSTGPSLPLWNHPAFTNKVLHATFPAAGNYFAPRKPMATHLLFSGGIRGYNWHRLFWLAAAERLALPIVQKLSSHRADGLSALESYTVYMQSLAEATCCLSLTMRTDQSCITTGRSFEVLFGGALLVEEFSPNMSYFFIAGEHYLAFSTLAELVAIIRFIHQHPEKAEAIRRSGHAFARKVYSDEKLIGYLDALLFFPDKTRYEEMECTENL